jgi:putative transcriptional regulator
MSTAKQKRKVIEAHEPDWAALDALTDQEIHAQIAANPDAAPDMSGLSLDDPNVRVMEPVDVEEIRRKTGLSQQEFARTFSLNLAALRDWERKRRMPRGPARALMQIIDREPEAACRALRKRGTG